MGSPPSERDNIKTPIHIASHGTASSKTSTLDYGQFSPPTNSISSSQSLAIPNHNVRQDSVIDVKSGPFQSLPPLTIQTQSSGPQDSVSTSTVPIFHVRQPSTVNTQLPGPFSTQHPYQPSGTPFSGPVTDLNRLTDANVGTSVRPSLQRYFSGEATQPIQIPAQSLRSQLSTMSFTSQHSLSPGSAFSSPSLAAMTDITPLPSPLLPDDSPGPWRRHARPGSSGSLKSLVEHAQVQDFNAVSARTPSSSRAPSTKRKKTYSNLAPPNSESASSRKSESGHARHRSLSDLLPEPANHVRPRNATLSGSINSIKSEDSTTNPPLQREEYLAEQRGLVQPQGRSMAKGPDPALSSLPTPPPSNRSVTESEGDERLREEESFAETLVVRDPSTGQKTHYRPVRPLGQGTFSKVVLATSQAIPGSHSLNEHAEVSLDPKQLVAIKIVGHGPAGGADEERVELSLKREVEIMQSVSHPSLIHLKAFDFNDDEALLVLGYCAGGDLFDLASQHREAMTPAVVQRIFAEVVDAVRYLHNQWIVHRDIKLENVLVNISPQKLLSLADYPLHPSPLITVTDLGLSRHIAKPPESPLLTTRCGSEDYAAPEILLSQPYDGRATDAWALGVLLYALMEGRLPFDPPPPRPGARVSRARSRAAHRIARCDWIWSRFGDVEGAWDENAGRGWEGGRDVVSGLLRKVTRGRWTLDQVSESQWVKEGIQVEGGLRREHD